MTQKEFKRLVDEKMEKLNTTRQQAAEIVAISHGLTQGDVVYISKEEFVRKEEEKKDRHCVHLRGSTGTYGQALRPFESSLVE